MEVIDHKEVVAGRSIRRAKETIETSCRYGLVDKIAVIAGVVPGSDREIGGVEQRLLFEKTQHSGKRAPITVCLLQSQRSVLIPRGEGTRWHGFVGAQVVVQGQADLLHVVDTLDAPRRLARRLHGGKSKRRSAPR